MPQITHIESNVTHNVSQNPIHKNGVWECGDQRFIDPDGTLFEPVLTAVPVIVSVTEFMLLFTAEERVKTRELRATDATINDFWLLLEHPKTENVAMVLPAIQASIQYTLEAIDAAGVDIDIPARKAQILSGQLPAA